MMKSDWIVLYMMYNAAVAIILLHDHITFLSSNVHDRRRRRLSPLQKNLGSASNPHSVSLVTYQEHTGSRHLS